MAMISEQGYISQMKDSMLWQKSIHLMAVMLTHIELIRQRDTSNLPFWRIDNEKFNAFSFT